MDWIKSIDQFPQEGQKVWTQINGVPILGIAKLHRNKFKVDCGSIQVINPEVWATYEVIY